MNCLTVICLFVGASLSSAQTIDLRPYNITAQNLFTANDVDKDKEMSHSELVLSFNGYDSNFDGVVSREEYTTYTTHQLPAMFVLTHALYDIYDSDKNGVLTEYDYEQLYKLWDANENGIVSELEFVHWWTVLNVRGKPDVMQVLDVYHFGETHEHWYGSDNPRTKIGRKWISNTP